MSIEKYSPTNKTWNKVATMYDDRTYFCACVFMNNIFVIGGREHGLTPFDSSLQFDTKSYKWKQTASLNEARDNAACSVFKGRIVISGGRDVDSYETNTVQVYDHVSNKWSYMPNMI